VISITPWRLGRRAHSYTAPAVLSHGQGSPSRRIDRHIGVRSDLNSSYQGHGGHHDLHDTHQPASPSRRKIAAVRRAICSVALFRPRRVGPRSRCVLFLPADWKGPPPRCLLRVPRSAFSTVGCPGLVVAWLDTLHLVSGAFLSSHRRLHSNLIPSINNWILACFGRLAGADYSGINIHRCCLSRPVLKRSFQFI